MLHLIYLENHSDNVTQLSIYGMRGYVRGQVYYLQVLFQVLVSGDHLWLTINHKLCIFCPQGSLNPNNKKDCQVAWIMGVDVFTTTTVSPTLDSSSVNDSG